MLKRNEALRLAMVLMGVSIASVAIAAPKDQTPESFESATVSSVFLSDSIKVSLDRHLGRVVIEGHAGSKEVRVAGASTAQLLVLPSGAVWVEGLQDAAGAATAGLEIRPETAEAVPADDAGMPRIKGGHFAVIADGRILAVTADGSMGYVWNHRSHAISTLRLGGSTDVSNLVLLRDGGVLIEDGRPTSPASQVIDIARSSKRPISANEATDLESAVPGWDAHSPTPDATDASPDQAITVILSKKMDYTTITSNTVVLFGPGGPVPASTRLIDDGRLLVITPSRDLFTGTRYTLFLKGLRDERGLVMPFASFGFTTVSLTTGVAAGAEPQGVPANSVSTGSSMKRAEGGSPGSSSTGTPSNTAFVSTGSQITGVAQTNEDCVPGSKAVTLCRAHSQIRDGAFYPGRDASPNAFGGHWRTYLKHIAPLGQPTRFVRRGDRSASSHATNVLPVGTVAGRVLAIDGRPVPGVTVGVANHSSLTSMDGTFSLHGLSPGLQTIFVDGASASRGGYEYGSFEVGVVVPDSGGLKLPYNMFIPRVLPRDKVSIPSPTTQDLAITHPDIPGLEIDIPAGTVIHDRNGKIVTNLAIVPTPVDRAPFPTNNNYPVYFSIIPGGAVIQNVSGPGSQGIRIKYPNFSHAAAGTIVKFWNYDTAKGWQVYGRGTVSPDGKQFVPDSGVALTTTIHGSYTNQSDEGGDSGLPCLGYKPCGRDGDPVDLATGAFARSWRELKIDDIDPIVFNRTYRSGDSTPRAFGIGTSSSLDMYLYDEKDDFSQPKLILPNLASVSFDPILGDPADSGSDVLAVWKSTASQGEFYGARLEHVEYLHNQFEEHWVIRTKTGEEYWFQNEQTNRLNQMVDRFGNTTTFDLSSGLLDSVTSPSGRTLTFSYDDQNRISSASDSAGRTVNYIYNAAGFLGEVDYPDVTNEKYTYDVSGNLLTIQDRRGNVVLTNQYLGGRVSQQTFADGGVVGYTYVVGQDGYSSQVTTTRPNGEVRVTNLDPLTHYTSSETYGFGTPLAQTTTYTRNAAGYVTGIVDALNRHTAMTYDAAGNMLTKTLLVGTPQEATTTYTYTPDFSQVASIKDPLGHMITFDYEDGCLVGVTNPLGKKITRTCTSFGRPLTTIDALGHGLQYSYSGFDLASVTDSLGRKRSFTTDGLGRMIAQMAPDGGVRRYAYDIDDRLTQQTDERGRATSYAYDNDGHLITLNMPGGHGFSFAWNTMGGMTKRTDSLSHDELFTYDYLGNPLTYKDRNGHTSTSHYDSLGRQDKVTFDDGSTIALDYDAADRLISVVDSSVGTTTFGYDGLDRRVSETSPQGSVISSFDLAGRRVGMTAGIQAATVYGYDDANRLSTITQGSEVVHFGYDDAGRRAQIVLPNGITGTYSYDDADELTGISYAQVSGTSVGGLSYSYDGFGHLASRSGTLNPSLAASPTTMGSVDANNRLIMANGNTLTYDANGNLIGDGTFTYVWNVRNQLAQVKQGATVLATFVYDGVGRRISKQIGGNPAVSALYDRQNIVQETSSGNVNPIMVGPNPDERYARNQGGSRGYFLTDNLGSTAALTSSAGSITQQYQYDAFGNTTSTGASDNPYQFTGRENDGNGLYFYRNRYYSPALGRFISADPLGLAPGPNPYAYVGDNPVAYVDPLGLWQVTIVGDFGLGGLLTFGYNSGQFNVGGFIGAGEGLSSSYTPNDSGCHQTGGFRGARADGRANVGSVSVDVSSTIGQGGKDTELAIETPVKGLGIAVEMNDGKFTNRPVQAVASAGDSVFAGLGGQSYYGSCSPSPD